jgi:nucleotide sugar dehydrogenase
MNIAVIGLGYVGLANALLLAQKNNLIGFDVDRKKINDLDSKKSPIKDPEIEEYLQSSTAEWSNNIESVVNSDLIIISTPTNYDEITDNFDTSSIEMTIEKVRLLNKNALFLIKSTIPVGYVESIRKKFNDDKIIFAPEFLREGKALYDNLHPSRIIIGEKSDRGQMLVDMFTECVLNDPQTLLTDPTEAEAIKLFANSYLATRIAYFNELDTYCAVKGLDSKSVITGVGLDPRIGLHYNNPSFGYGGYCLPKDTKQLKTNFTNVPNNIISAVVEANQTRKNFISNEILNRNPKIVGVYRLAMKNHSDNFRQAAILDIMKSLKNSGIEIVIFEPSISEYENYIIENDFQKFVETSDIIIANRKDPILLPIIDKVYTRDIFDEN